MAVQTGVPLGDLTQPGRGERHQDGLGGGHLHVPVEGPVEVREQRGLDPDRVPEAGRLDAVWGGWERKRCIVGDGRCFVSGFLTF